MNSKEFVKDVFEMIWHKDACVEHYKNGLADLPGRDNYYTYEATLKKLKMGIDSLNKKPINDKPIKSMIKDSMALNNMYGYPVDD